tara:strand:+ start:2756 stop:3283 length:528 start_codon:yes stop_codon:yes gene_type:complete
MNKIPGDSKLPPWIEANVPKELATSEMFRFKVRINVPGENTKTQNIEVDILPDLSIDWDVLEEQMMEMPAQYAFWASVYSELRAAVSIAERKLKIRKGEAIEQVQEEARANDIRISVEQQKLILEANPPLVQADARLANAQMKAGKAYHMVKALEMKHEICRSLIGLKKGERDKS